MLRASAGTSRRRVVANAPNSSGAAAVELMIFSSLSAAAVERSRVGTAK